MRRVSSAGSEGGRRSDSGWKAHEALHPSWIALIRHCRQLGYGTIEKLKIQDGLPVVAEESVKRTKFL